MDSSVVIFTANSNSVESCIRLKDILDLGENFDDVLFSSSKNNTDKTMEGSSVTTDDIFLALGEKINNSLVVDIAIVIFYIFFIYY